MILDDTHGLDHRPHDDSFYHRCGTALGRRDHFYYGGCHGLCLRHFYFVLLQYRGGGHYDCCDIRDLKYTRRRGDYMVISNYIAIVGD